MLFILWLFVKWHLSRGHPYHAGVVGYLLGVTLGLEPPDTSIRGVCWSALAFGCDCLPAHVLELFPCVPICPCRTLPHAVVTDENPSQWSRAMDPHRLTWVFSGEVVLLSTTSQKIISFSLLAAHTKIPLTPLTQNTQLCSWEKFKRERPVSIFFFLINRVHFFRL